MRAGADRLAYAGPCRELWPNAVHPYSQAQFSERNGSKPLGYAKRPAKDSIGSPEQPCSLPVQRRAQRIGRPASTGGVAREAEPAEPARTGEQAKYLAVDLLGVRIEVEQDACGDALVLAHQREQQVLGRLSRSA